MDIRSYQLTVTGDDSGDHLFDLCSDLHARGAVWFLKHFKNGELVDVEDSFEFSGRHVCDEVQS